MRVSREARSPLATGITFTIAAWRYWLGVFPCVRDELHHWRRRARVIPDCPLRKMALAVQHTKRGNIDGSAAFAVFAPQPHRRAVVRAQLGFQAIYDYVDTLAEQPHSCPIDNARQLHRALPDALDLARPPTDYYKHHTHREDSGYLPAIVSACRTALGSLPAYPVVAQPACRLAERIVCFQSLNLTEAQGSYHALARWAHQQTPRESGLRWWETAASAGSSLGIFALMVSATRSTTDAHEAAAIECAYFPWIGSLHSLLDSLIDQPEDAATKQHNLIQHYRSPGETAARLRLLADASVRHARAMPRGLQHAVILAGMASHYLCAGEAGLPHATLAKIEVLEAIGDLARPTMLVFQLRQVARAPRAPFGST
jgi:tetraprenyl-beta-curcumene synthase